MSLSKEDAAKLRKLVEDLFSGYSSAESTPARMNTYYSDFKTVPVDILEIAIPNVRQNIRKFPSVADVLDEARRLVAARQTAEDSRKRKEKDKEPVLPDSANDVQKYMFAINHNDLVMTRKKEPLYKQMRVAEVHGDTKKVEVLRQAILDIHQYYNMVGYQIQEEFKRGFPISYLKEIENILPMNTSKEKGFQSVGGVGLSQIIQGARSDKGAIENNPFS